jgi:Zn-finger nucleic acid-binding protein
MVYLNCPRCGLSLAMPRMAVIEHCPRCIARRRLVLLFESRQLPGRNRSPAPRAPRGPDRSPSAPDAPVGEGAGRLRRARP